MNRENKIQSFIKLILIGVAAISTFFNFSMMISEPGKYRGLEIVVVFLYHLVAAAAPGAIVFLILKPHDEKEAYSSYIIAVRFALSSLVSVCVLIEYINYAGQFDEVSPLIVTLCIILAILGLGAAFLFFKLGKDRITCLLPLIALTVISVYRALLLISIDNRLFEIKLLLRSEKIGFYTVGVFVDGFMAFMVVLLTLIYLYMDFLSDLVHDPKRIFSKGAVFDTLSNMYDEEVRKADEVMRRQGVTAQSENVIANNH